MLSHRVGRLCVKVLVVAVLSMCSVSAQKIQTLGPQCYREDMGHYLDDIRSTDPLFAMMLDQLNIGNPPTVIIRGINHTDWSPSHTELRVRATPDLSFFRTRRYWDSGVCLDPEAGLLHELWHAMQEQTGTRDKTLDPSGIARFEIEATMSENKFREAKGLCPRPSYEGIRLPPFARSSKECANPLDIMCKPSVSLCDSYQTCCWIYNLENRGGVCVKQLSIDECHYYNMIKNVNASDNALPCATTFPGVPMCQ